MRLRTPERFAPLYQSAPCVSCVSKVKPVMTVMRRCGRVRLVRLEYPAFVTQSRWNDPRTGLPWQPHYWGKRKRWAVQVYRERAWRDYTNSCYYDLELGRFRRLSK